MALIKCPECGAEISDKAPKCPKCGRSIKNNNKKIVIALISIVLVLAIVTLSNKHNSNSENDKLPKTNNVDNELIGTWEISGMTMGDSRSVVTKNQFQESGDEFNGKLIIKDENFSFTLNSAKDSGTWSRFEDGDSDDSESYVLSGEQNYYIVLLSSEDDELWFLVGNASENDDSDSTMFIFEKIR